MTSRKEESCISDDNVPLTVFSRQRNFSFRNIVFHVTDFLLEKK